MFRKIKTQSSLTRRLRDIEHGESIRGVGPRISEERDPILFHRLSTSIETIVHVGHEPRMIVTAQENLIHIPKITCKHKFAVIETTQSYQSTEKMMVELWTPILLEMIILGLGNVSVDGLKEDECSVFHDGLGAVRFHGNAKLFSVEHKGLGNFECRGLNSDRISIRHESCGKMKMEGQVSELILSGGGMGTIDLRSLKSNLSKIDHDGMGDVHLSVSEAINGSASGMGNIFIYGGGSSGIHHTGMGKVLFR